ncbi:MAG TPA: lysophospholipase [Anaerolineales bacterium]|nr:lysophospholipase [Anaerolineales bacterium]
MNEDITFYIQGWEPEGKPKAVVCLVHGLGEHTGRFEHVGRALNEAGYALFGFDLRGHGQSGGPRGHIPSLEVVVSDIHQFVGFQKGNFPDTPVFVYGHSLGGMLALAYAIHHGDGLQGVVATGAGFRSPLEQQKAKIALAKFLGSLVPALTLPSGLDPSTISRDAAVVQTYVSDPLVHNKLSAGLGKTMLTGIEFCFAHAMEITCPILLMHGADDRLVYPSGSKEFAALASEANRDVTLKLWDGLHHEIHNEPEQQEVFDFMIEWLDRHL